MKKKFYITTPIYYPNAKPHIGSIYSTVLADIISRYVKLGNQEVVFLTGFDEHGQKVAQAAEKANKNPKMFVDELTEIFKSMLKQWNIDYTIFMRTTNQFHIDTVQQWIVDLQKKDLIYKAEYKGWYSITSESFLLEKDCELKNEHGIPLCPITQKPAIWLIQEAYFFRLSLFQDKILKFFKENPLFITPKERIEEVVSFVKGGLNDLCISRLKKDLSWGISFPNDHDHVVYVWADALNNYITAIGYLQNNKKFNDIWPCDMHIMAKDIIRFHAVYWLAFLMAADLPLPKRELVHGWLLFNNQKMSKSLQNIVDPIDILEKYHIDSVRYYFATLSIKEDSNFNVIDLEKKHNSDLCDNLSNLLQRMLILCNKKNIFSLNFNYNILSDDYKNIILYGIKIINQIQKEIFDGNFIKITQLIMSYLNQLNSFFHQQQPWKEDNILKIEQIMNVIAFGLFQAAVLLYPIMPEKMSNILLVLGINFHEISFDFIKDLSERIFKLTLPKDYIFKKININSDRVILNNEHKIIQEDECLINNNDKLISYISFDQFLKHIILVGKIIQVDDIVKSEKLYYLTVDFGLEGIKKIASGIKLYYKKEDLIGIQSIFSFNLEPRSLCGVISSGMILMVKDISGVPQLIKISDGVISGTRIG